MAVLLAGPTKLVQATVTITSAYSEHRDAWASMTPIGGDIHRDSRIPSGSTRFLVDDRNFHLSNLNAERETLIEVDKPLRAAVETTSVWAVGKPEVNSSSDRPVNKIQSIGRKSLLGHVTRKTVLDCRCDYQ